MFSVLNSQVAQSTNTEYEDFDVSAFFDLHETF